MELLSIRDAVLTVSPNKQYRGLHVPTTLATTGPEWKPTWIFTNPLSEPSTSIIVLLAALIASTEKSMIRLA